MSLTTEQLRALCIKHAVRPDKNCDIPRNFWNALSELNGMFGDGELKAYLVNWPMENQIGMRRLYMVPEWEVHRGTVEFLGGKPFPLYTAPAPTPAPAVEPLTDERIAHLKAVHVGDPSGKYPLTDKDWTNFARAIEAAHGIGAQK